MTQIANDQLEKIRLNIPRRKNSDVAPLISTGEILFSADHKSAFVNCITHESCLRLGSVYHIMKCNIYSFFVGIQWLLNVGFYFQSLLLGLLLYQSHSAVLTFWNSSRHQAVERFFGKLGLGVGYDLLKSYLLSWMKR